MKYWVIAAILLGNMILQSTLLPFLQIVGIQPDTLMVLVTCFGLLDGSGYGMFIGLAGGLLQDVLYGNQIGYTALEYMITGYLIGLLFERIFVDKIFVPTIVVLCGSLFRGILMMGYMYFTRSVIPPEYSFTLVVLPEALYTAISMPLVFYLMSLLFSQRFMKKKWRFRRR